VTGAGHHLGLEEWVRLDVGDELELSAPVLSRYGVLWPANALRGSGVFDAEDQTNP